MMKLKRSTIPLPLVLFLLLLLGSNSSFSFSSNTVFPESQKVQDYQEDFCNSTIGEQVNQLYDSLLPVQKDLFFNLGDFGTARKLTSHLLYHTGFSEDYIKRSRTIFPAFGVKEVIYPFHVFL